MYYFFLFSILLVDGIAVGLQIAFKVPKHRYSSYATSGGTIIKQHGSFQWSVVDPIISLMGSAFFITIQYLYRGLVYLQVSFGFGVKDELFIKWFKFDKRSEEHTSELQSRG